MVQIKLLTHVILVKVIDIVTVQRRIDVFAKKVIVKIEKMNVFLMFLNIVKSNLRMTQIKTLMRAKMIAKIKQLTLLIRRIN